MFLRPWLRHGSWSLPLDGAGTVQFVIKSSPILYVTAFLAVWTPAFVAWPQLDVRIETPKQAYLQYAEVPFQVRLRNLGAQPTSLRGVGEKPWLTMLVQDQQGRVIPEEKLFVPPDTTVPAGGEAVLTVDLNQYFMIRETGAYRVRASLRLPTGESLLTEPLGVLVGKGEVIWTQARGEGEGQRIYSLLRYFENPATGLYLRVELPEKNQMFPARRLGPYLPLIKPDARFDLRNNLHLLYVVGAGRYRLLVVNPDGATLREEIREDTAAGRPQLASLPDGEIEVRGGSVVLPSHLRERLSTLQGRLSGPPMPPARP